MNESQEWNEKLHATPSHINYAIASTLPLCCCHFWANPRRSCRRYCVDRRHPFHFRSKWIRHHFVWHSMYSFRRNCCPCHAVSFLPSDYYSSISYCSRKIVQNVRFNFSRFVRNLDIWNLFFFSILVLVSGIVKIKSFPFVCSRR